MRRFASSLLLVLAACGDNGDAIRHAVVDAAADVAVDAAPFAPPDATAACAPNLSPADGATRVDPLASIVVDFAAPVPAGTVISVYAPHATNPIPATIAIAGCRLTVTPTYALDAWATYRIRGAGITASFETVHDPWVKRIAVTQAGAITSGELHTIDADGNMLEQRAISSVGPDGLLGTADDHVSYLAQFTYEHPDATTTLVHQYVDIGPGAGTNNANTRYENDPALPYWRTFSLRAADGTIGNFQERTFDADGKTAVYAIWSSTGPDATPFTDDDTLEVAYLVTPVATYVLDGSGLVGMTDLARDGAGRIVHSSEHAPGPDLRIDTPDDTIDQTFAYDYAPTGQLTDWRAWSNGVLYHHDVRTFDARGNQLAQSDVVDGWESDVISYAPLVAP